MESLRTQANVAEEAGEANIAKAIRQVALNERQYKAFRQLNGILGKDHKAGGITRLQVPISWPTSETYDPNVNYNLEDPKQVKEAADWREVNCPKEIEFLLRLRNQRHFGQAE